MIRSPKSRRAVLFLVLLLLVGVLFGLSSLEQVGQPTFSRESGFYEEPFYLEISADNAAEIYYTLDGSLPDRQSEPYTRPILLTDATQKENTHSMNRETSAGFRTDLLEEYQVKDGNPGYRAPDYLLDKCHVFRAVAYSPDGTASEVVSASYFVGLEPARYDGCSIVSMVTDPHNLFDSKDGIYVMGDHFDKYLEKGGISDHWHEWEANYRQRGKDWERPAEFFFFGSDGVLESSQAGGIRVRGDFSRASLPRSLSLYARVEYDKTDSFSFAPFETDYIPQRIALSAGGNETHTQFPDYMMTRMTRHMNFTTMLHEPYVLFINGEYWGFYWLTEKFDEDYLAHYYQVDENNVIIVKNFGLEQGLAADYQLFEDMRSFISDNDMTLEENYRRACQLIDVESCIDYYAAMVYIGRHHDWPMSNEACWRVRNPASDSPYSDGRWRWMMFDCNSPAMYSADHQTLDHVIGRDPVFSSLWENPSFRDAFTRRLLEIGKNEFSREKMLAFIADFTDTMLPVMEKSWARFHGSGNNVREAFFNRMDGYAAFFEDRYATVESWFA